MELMEPQNLVDLRFEMCCLDWFPEFYSSDESLSTYWCEFSSEMYFAGELVVRPEFVEEFKKWYKDTKLQKQFNKNKGE